MFNTRFSVAVVALMSLVFANFTYAAVIPDVPGTYEFELAISFLYDTEILSGDSDTGNFRPLDTLNRAEFASVLTRMLGEDPSLAEFHDCFPDVQQQWYAPHVCWAKENGYVKGYSAGELAGMYGPGHRLANADLVEILNRIFNWDTVPGGEWYEPAWNFAVSRGLIGAINFYDPIIRGQMAETIFRDQVVRDLSLEVYDSDRGTIYVADHFEEFEKEVEILGSVTEDDDDDTGDTGDMFVFKDDDEEFDPMNDSPEYLNQCALFDNEFNLPFPAENKTVNFNSVPAEPAEPVIVEVDGHVVIPVDQGEEGICAATSVYSSLRWFEERFDKELIENGRGGLDSLIAQFYGDHIPTNTAQYQRMESYLESEFPGCLEVSYDTQAGLNVACTELKEYQDMGCDIPISFRCTKIDENGDPLTGDDAEEWGHLVDLVNVEVDADDDDQCTITFANSWNDPANPGVDLDGLGSGRYEAARYNDDTEVFDLQSPWGDQYSCVFNAAIYICIDVDECPE